MKTMDVPFIVLNYLLLENTAYFPNFVKTFLFIAPAYSKVRYRGSTFCPFVRLFVRSSIHPSTIYVTVLTL